jgi:hypothetical protein
MEEEWREIEGYEGIYEVSSLGRIKSLERDVLYCSGKKQPIKERILKPSISGSGYYFIALQNQGKRKVKDIHRIVAETFLGVPDGKNIIVNHINLNKKDNRLSNLEFITQRENCDKKHLPSSSKFVGVSLHKRDKTWQARILVDGERVQLGSFKTEQEAHKAYQDKLNSLNER